MNNPIGRHILAEYINCQCNFLSQESRIRQVMLEAATRSRATIIGDLFHQFNPHGVTGVVVIAESHLAIHTWPEHQYASVDLFTCGTTVDPWIAFQYLKEMFQPDKWYTKEIVRGTQDGELIEVAPSKAA